MSEHDQSLKVLIEEMLDGNLDEDQRADLLKRVNSDDESRKLYLDQIATHTALQAVLADCHPHGAGAPSDSKVETQSTLSSRSKWPAFAAIASVAAAIMLLIGSIAYFGSPNQKLVESGEVPYPAFVTQAVGAYDSEGVAIRSGQPVASGEFLLERGVVRLDFVNGARLAVEGPAKIKVVGEMRVVLQRGVVTATIPEPAIGFVVDTDTAQVVDLGTAFGVSVEEDGTTDVCVFEGEVSVRRIGTTASEVALVREGQAVRASELSVAVEPMDYEVAAFENAWPVNSGVLQTTGAIRFVSPGPDFDPGHYEDNENIVVFPERSNFSLSDEMRVDMVDPGEYARSQYRDKPMLVPGHRLTSYLLQLDAYSEAGNSNRRRSVRGQITFAQPIVGVITATRLLKESEVICGNPGVDYPVAREVEPRPEGDQRPGFDSVILAADRRTLILDLIVSPQKLDQLRILVEAEQ